VYSLDAEAGEIRFGDGLHGARPPGGRRILASYQYGGGPQGNLGIGAVNASKDLRLQGGYKLANPLPFTGGTAGESAADGVRRIPRILRHQERLVAAQDYRDIARRAPGVELGRVDVLPLFRPGSPQANPPIPDQADAPGVVTVMVVPANDPRQPFWPQPDRLFLQRVCNHLEPRRLVTTELYVRGPVYLPVFVSVGLQTRAGFFADFVEETVRQTMNLYLTALPPGGPEGRGWPLSKRLLRKDLEAVITRVAGVEYVESIELGVESLQDVEAHDLAGMQLPRLAGLSVRQGPAEPLANIFAPPAPSGETRVILAPVSRAHC
jgi:predicted phage baseplate assembly protein